MKKTGILRIIQLGFIYAGCFLGAGYVSGQELWQFFGIFGKNGFIGMMISLVLFLLFGYLVMNLSLKTKITRMDEIVIPFDNKKLKSPVGFIQVFFITGIYIIMCAGAGALLNQLIGIHIIIGSALFSIAVLFMALKGIKGVSDVFSLFVPPLVIGAVIIGMTAVFKNGFSFPDISLYEASKSPLISNPVSSAFVFVSYNFFASIGILAPISQKYNKKSEIFGGILCGCIFLAVISFCILSAMNSVCESISNQLPMLFIAKETSSVAGYIYAFLLLGAMFGTSLSSIVAICEYTKEKYSFNKRKTNILTIILSITACMLSIAGFDKLINTVYPLCGIFGFFALILIVVHYLKIK